MFTGIVEEVGMVEARSPSELRITATTTLLGTRAGDSIAVNGTCLTVTHLQDRLFRMQVVPETWRRTNLGTLASGDLVNLERPVPLSGRLGGHWVQGHIDGTGRIVEMRPEGNAIMVRMRGAAEILQYIVEKGFIAIDGISLTVVQCNVETFSVALIPFTRDNTNFKTRKVEDTVNLEVDILAKYVKKFLQGAAPGEGGELGASSWVMGRRPHAVRNGRRSPERYRQRHIRHHRR